MLGIEAGWLRTFAYGERAYAYGCKHDGEGGLEYLHVVLSFAR